MHGTDIKTLKSRSQAHPLRQIYALKLGSTLQNIFTKFSGIVLAFLSTHSTFLLKKNTEKILFIFQFVTFLSYFYRKIRVTFWQYYIIFFWERTHVYHYIQNDKIHLHYCASSLFSHINL